jgi:segregation and condensation protein B
MQQLPLTPFENHIYSIETIERMLEALLFASTEPISLSDLAKKFPEKANVRTALYCLQDRYKARGVNLVQIDEKWAFRTAIDLSYLLHEHRVEAKKLSRAAIETLAIIAYHQPVTRAEIEQIRGVAVSKGTLDVLMEQNWVKFGKRRETAGRPVSFVTTTEFLDYFGLTSLQDLPNLQDMKNAGLLDNFLNVSLSESEKQLDLKTEDESDLEDDDHEILTQP